MSDRTNDAALRHLAERIDRLLPADREFVGRLVDDLARRPEPAATNVVRTERLEVIDGDGRVRLVVGDLSRLADEGYFPGVALHDADGSERAALVVTADGPAFSFTLAGDTALLMGVDDPDTEAASAGPYFELYDRPGTPMIGWRVHDGVLAQEGPAVSAGP